MSRAGRQDAATSANVGSPLPGRHDSCASQQASGSPSVRQCAGHVSQMKQGGQVSQLPRSWLVAITVRQVRDRVEVA